jgi:hypothetical protein
MPKHVGVENLERINKTSTTSLSICWSFCKRFRCHVTEKGIVHYTCQSQHSVMFHSMLFLYVIYKIQRVVTDGYTIPSHGKGMFYTSYRPAEPNFLSVAVLQLMSAQRRAVPLLGIAKLNAAERMDSSVAMQQCSYEQVPL